MITFRNYRSQQIHIEGNICMPYNLDSYQFRSQTCVINYQGKIQNESLQLKFQRQLSRINFQDIYETSDFYVTRQYFFQMKLVMRSNFFLFSQRQSMSGYQRPTDHMSKQKLRKLICNVTEIWKKQAARQMLSPDLQESR